MHQPSYTDPTTGEVRMPWVRLHGVKDYTDMAVATELAPESARVTINWVPGLWDQIDDVAAADYAQRDRFWRLTRAAPSELSDRERRFIERHFFSLNHQWMLAPHARYASLRDRVAAGHRLADDELMDLQVWFNLAWCGDKVTRDPVVASLLDRGRDFGTDDKEALFDAQRRALGELQETYAQLAATGRVELCCTPYYHPILPLLVDTHLARVSDPQSPLPGERFRWPADARTQVQRAVASHTARFGQQPNGMWPAEGSVAEPVVQYFAASGIDWIVTDEEILHKSLGRGALSARERFRPWSREGVKIFFRDHVLSDRIGFVYSNWPRERAWKDFADQLQGICEQLGGADGVVTIALDGENAWEHYEGGITAFLPGLYAEILKRPGLVLSTFSEAAAAVESGQLPRLGAGSWIDGSFRTWLGDPAKNRAWDALARAREAVGREMSELEAEDPELARLVLAAEASDWWWWFGEGHSSDFDDEFDALFRAHLRAIYQRLGRPAPAALEEPLSSFDGSGVTTQSNVLAPRTQLRPPVDGDVAWFYKWAGAGELRVGFGAIHRSDTVVARALYGNDDSHLSLRLDTDGPASRVLAGHQLVLRLDRPEHGEVTLWPASGDDQVQSCAGRVFEAAVPLALLGASASDAQLRCRFEVRGVDGLLVETLPAEGWANLELVDRFEAAMNHWL